MLKDSASVLDLTKFYEDYSKFADKYFYFFFFLKSDNLLEEQVGFHIMKILHYYPITPSKVRPTFLSLLYD
jgi:hypothetical protein